MLSQNSVNTTISYRGKNFAEIGNLVQMCTLIMIFFAHQTKNILRRLGCVHFMWDGICNEEEGTERYQPAVENAAFHRHTKLLNDQTMIVTKTLPCRPIEKHYYQSGRKCISDRLFTVKSSPKNRVSLIAPNYWLRSVNFTHLHLISKVLPSAMAVRNGVI